MNNLLRWLNILKSQDGSIKAILDDYAPVVVNGMVLTKTIRTVKCELLLDGDCVKCTSCKSYRATLRTLYNRFLHRSSDMISDASSHANIRYMNTPEKKKKISNLKKRVQSAEKELSKLQAKVKQLTQKQGESVSDALHDDLRSIMEENSDQIAKAYPEGSFRRLFWEEQLRAASLKDSRAMRWHPLIIRWCLNLRLISSAAYHVLLVLSGSHLRELYVTIRIISRVEQDFSLKSISSCKRNQEYLIYLKIVVSVLYLWMK